MQDLFSKRDDAEKLKKRFAKLMRKSYEAALTDKEKSDLLNSEACKIRKKLKEFNLL